MKVTFLIAGWKEEKYIGECIEYIKSLDYPKKNIEIIVSADSSTGKIAKEYKDVNVFVERKRGGKWKALTRMMKHATGDIIVVNDADNFIFPPDALKRLVKHFKNPKVGGVSFTSIISPTELKESSWVLTDYLIYLLTRYYQSKRFPVKSMKEANFPIITNSFRNGIIKRVETINDDGETSYKMLKAGYHIDFAYDVMWYSKGGTVTNIPDFYKQKTRTNMGWNQVKKKYKLDFTNFYFEIFLLFMITIFNMFIYILGYVATMVKSWFMEGEKAPEKVWKKTKRY